MERIRGAPAGTAYPIRLEIARPESQSRVTNFPFTSGIIRAVLLVPHLIVLYFLSIAATIAYFFASFAILFTGRYPPGLFKFAVGVTRWTTHVFAYWSHLRDDYPPFSVEAGLPYVLLAVDYPERSSRLLNLPWVGIFIKLVLLIPHLIVLKFLLLAVLLVTLVAEFGILFTGSYPQGPHSFVVGVGRWWLRTNTYSTAMTDRYPPFSFN